jgi:flavin reductase (DIM6/NTAB) family NADH-FMN oxidoreductase RutF
METVVSIDSKEDQDSVQPQPVAAAALRDAMSRFLTGVTIVTTRGLDGAPYGLTVNSFNSVSLDPPLVLWSLDLGHDKADLFRHSGGFTVNIIAGDGMDLIRRFAATDAERFTGTDWHWGVTGQPVLDSALASMECRLWAEYPGGDHVIFVGEVMNIRTRDGHPAAYYKGQLSAYPS